MSDELCTAILIAVAAGVLLAIGFFIGVKTTREEATEANVAYYAADPKTGVTTFTWKSCEEPRTVTHDK